ncbi:alpha/beta hydrolase fold domain-containing protein [Lentzea sp. BCCO 10_0798]|uniref:Alpha/beta hydrolase fold domain-containing protein n=1 Tax=Lentzea kristufekii TaxID=3095430 RepID=A0ABU4U602_9PSEU|nr:alpha/beta hydrolase fold domain-containing protein [Lentzea sp. BCCO 10_0798]MDX8055542.1 alpha/beta hydrolase fold domain-containing protein [Lentzea sp. BCCO 10_0798]
MARPAFDPELSALLAEMPLSTELSHEMLQQIRRMPSPPFKTDAERHDVTVGEITLTVFRPRGLERPAPCVYWIHGGGMMMGDRFSQIDIPLQWLEELGVVVVTVEHRLAPEATGTTLVDDCYNGLLWTVENAGELGIGKIVVAGISAGGGLAAGVALMARDLDGPEIAAQVLICPMLDHRNDSTSSRQYSGDPGVWTREMNEFGWRSVLGDRTDVSRYVSPALAEDLSGLPATYVDTGTAEVFRDEDAAYASRIWAAGGDAELHAWAGGFHGFDAIFPAAGLSVQARRTRTDWLARRLV